MKTIIELKQAIKNESARSAWGRGVQAYALELLEELEEKHGSAHEVHGSPADRKELLNGAESWSQYSWGGCSYIYDYQIAERLCSPSELKKSRGGERRPNKREEWLDTQSRALSQAASLILRLTKY